LVVKKLDSLEAWNCGRQLSRAAYKLTMQTPLSRHFGLSDQIRRASASVPANIAEGYAMGTTPQFIKYLRIALGSATELSTHIELAKDMELAAADKVETALQLCNREIGLLIGLVFSLGRRQPSFRSPVPPPSSPVP